MKYVDPTAFENHLRKQAAHDLPHAYLIVSKDTFVQKKMAGEIVKTLLKNAPRTEVLRISLEGALDPLFGEVQNPSLFSPEKLIVVDGLDSLSKDLFTVLEQVVRSLPNQVRLTLLSSDLKSDPKFYERLKSFLVLLDLRAEKPWELRTRMEGQLIKTVAHAGKRIDIEAVRLLIDRCGLDQSNLTNQIEKIICFVGGSPQIDTAAVNAFFYQTLPFDGWKMVDALLFRKGALSPFLLLTDVQELFGFFGQLRHRIYTAMQIVEGGAPVALKPQMVEKIRPLVIKFSGKYYEKVLAIVFDLELMMRSERFEPQDAITQLLAKVDEASQNYPAPQPAYA